MLSPLDLLLACQNCYSTPTVTGGPDGRDGASVARLPSGETLLVFRGTLTTGERGFLDWLNDLRARLVSRPEYPGKVHDGFASALDDLWPKLPSLSGPLVITGHSKGGALAQLAYTRLFRSADAWRAPAALHCITFAAPMVGDYDFMYGARSPLRYENPHDIVPRLPPVDYWPVGRSVGPPRDWLSPHGVIANHELETGYKPWILTVSQAA